MIDKSVNRLPDCEANVKPSTGLTLFSLSGCVHGTGITTIVVIIIIIKQLRAIEKNNDLRISRKKPALGFFGFLGIPVQSSPVQARLVPLSHQPDPHSRPAINTHKKSLAVPVLTLGYR
ncbi:hypothetical protein CDEST_03820 [Colletotrichum destructivum]|uniref:Uncharacterized protein n=1 Tax=Colletotrichum destructivum TaxID=34406 RepID=A0AAX4I6X7_9PEZI|nr:hypothetical protein CDEST_03820 [Colletotrichum destructivum]